MTKDVTLKLEVGQSTGNIMWRARGRLGGGQGARLVQGGEGLQEALAAGALTGPGGTSCLS